MYNSSPLDEVAIPATAAAAAAAAMTAATAAADSVSPKNMFLFKL